MNLVKKKLPPNWEQMTEEEKTKWVTDMAELIEQGDEGDDDECLN
jgi:hypothetical protein